MSENQVAKLLDSLWEIDKAPNLNEIATLMCIR